MLSRGLVLLALAGSVPAAAQFTYAREISRIFQAKCQQCHRPNDIAPFSLDSYEAARTWAEDIKRVVSRRIMPPWKPVPGYGSFRDSYGLTDEERDQIIRWADDGAPFGLDSDLPEPLPGRGDWILGEPDLVLEMPEAYTPPRGKDMYRCFVLPAGADATRYVSAADILPGDRSIVHHVILYLDTSGVAEQLDAADPEPGYTCFGGPGTPAAADPGGGSPLSLISSLLANGMALGGWAPGARPRHLADGIGMALPANARVVMQVHYYARGRTAEDRTKAGLYFAKSKVERRLLFVPILPIDIRGRINMTIPAGSERHVIETSLMIPPLFDAHVHNIFPHMHLLGREIKAEVQRPRRDAEPLVFINDWDFNWQGAYAFNEPVALPAFSNVKLSCTYDNSERNPRNPSNPVKTVTWGEGTEDEMCLVFLGLTFDRERL
jgi:hypothetical protein